MDAHRLRIISLGKFQDCQQQLCDRDLYKTLLIANVLYQTQFDLTESHEIEVEKAEERQCNAEIQSVVEDQSVPSVDTALMENTTINKGELESTPEAAGNCFFSSSSGSYSDSPSNCSKRRLSEDTTASYPKRLKLDNTAPASKS